MIGIFVDRDRLKELEEDPEFVAHLSPMTLVRCYYCERVNAQLSDKDICGTCNGPLEHGYPLAGAYHGDVIWLRPE